MATAAEQGWFSNTFAALNVRLVNKQVSKVLPGGWFLADAPEVQEANPVRSKRPFAVFVPIAVDDTRYTNKTKYATLELRLDIEADQFATLDGSVCPAVTGALQNADASVIPVPNPAQTGAVVITMIRPGRIEYEKADQIWTARMTFYVQANQPAAGTQAN